MELEVRTTISSGATGQEVAQRMPWSTLYVDQNGAYKMHSHCKTHAAISILLGIFNLKKGKHSVRNNFLAFKLYLFWAFSDYYTLILKY